MKAASLWIPLIFFFSLTVGSKFTLDEIRSPEEKRVFVPPPKYAKHLTFGYHESFADSLWLRVIQDLSYCEEFGQQKEVEIVQEVDFDESKLIDKKMAHVIKQVREANKGRKVCRKGWVFLMLDTITELAPEFKVPYSAGAVTLSVLIDDYEGAAVLFDKAVERFPNDWQILYRAAYHYLFDQKDFAKAADLLLRAGNAGAPNWVKGLAATLYTKEGQLGLALTILESFRERVKDTESEPLLDERIEQIKRQGLLLHPEKKSEIQ